MQFSGSITTWPRLRVAFFAGLTGYISVAGCFRRLLITVPVISKNVIAVSPLRAADTGVDRQDNDRHIGEFARP